MLLVLPTLIIWKRRKKLCANARSRTISIISTRHVGQATRINNVKHRTSDGFMAQNELDTHADTYCAGANWSPMELTGEICEVNPFLASYQPAGTGDSRPVARCSTVWTDQIDSMEYLLVGDQMLWFGTLLPNSLINPYQMLAAYELKVYDDPFDTSQINSDVPLLIPFKTTGTVVHFESRVLTEWEKTHLPIILLMSEERLESISRSVA